MAGARTAKGIERRSLISLALLLIACGSRARPPASRDAGPDSGPPGGVDASLDASVLPSFDASAQPEECPEGTADAPMLRWVRLTGNGYLAPYPLAVDSAGTLLLGGSFFPEVRLSEGEVDEIHLTVGAGSMSDDLFVAAVRPDGALTWARSGGGTTYDDAEAIAPSPEGGLWLAGRVGADAALGVGDARQTALDPGLFLARYQADGSLAWAASTATGGFGGNREPRLAALAGGGVLLAGQFDGSATFGAGEATETTLWGDGMFLAQYDADGNLESAAKAEGAWPQGVSAFADGSTVLVGYYCVGATFGDEDASPTVFEGGGGCGPEDHFEPCLFVARYGIDGSLDWARAACAEPGGFATANAITVVGDEIAIAGSLGGRVTFWSDGTEQVVAADRSGYLALLSGDGDVRWMTMLGDAYAESIATDGDGIVTAGPFGWWGGDAVYGPDTVLRCSGLALARYSSDGSLTWVRAIRGEPAFGTGYSAFLGADLERSPEGALFLTTSFIGTVTLGEGEPNEVELSTQFSRGLLARFDPQEEH